MDGEALVRRCCKEKGLDFDQLFYFSVSRVSLHPGKRIVQSCESHKIGNKEFIMRYYPDNDIFFVWNHIYGRSSCSFGVPQDYSISPGTIRVDEKRIGDSKDTEPVYSFVSNDIGKFLDRCC